MGRSIHELLPEMTNDGKEGRKSVESAKQDLSQGKCQASFGDLEGTNSK